MNAGRVELVGLGLEKLVLEPNIGLRARGAPVVEATRRACGKRSGRRMAYVDGYLERGGGRDEGGVGRFSCTGKYVRGECGERICAGALNSKQMGSVLMH